MYPLKFDPILKSIIWGGNEICKFKNIEPKQDGIGESWEIAQVKKDISIVAEGPLKGKTLTELIEEKGAALMGRHVLERYGNKFPLLIKFIDARDDLSIQVHPDDKLAAKRHDSFGKTEMWYVISAQEGAGLYSGFSQQITPDEYVERVENNTFMDVLQFHPVKSGDVFFLPAGRVHAIGKGIFIAEIQQTSDITYRIYDYNRKDANGNGRELHTQLAKDAIDYTQSADYKTAYKPVVDQPVELATCQYFTTNLLTLTHESTRTVADKDSFVIYMCMDGKASLTDNNGSQVSLNAGDTILVPASTEWVKITPDGLVKVVECYV